MIGLTERPSWFTAVLLMIAHMLSCSSIAYGVKTRWYNLRITLKNIHQSTTYSCCKATQIYIFYELKV